MAKLLQFLTIVALAGSSPASAQLLDSAARPLDGPRRVSVGVTIPFGGPATTPAKPQLELRAAADRGRDDARGIFPGPSDPIAWNRREARIGLTLESHPRLTVAGREVSAQDNGLGISTVGYVAIGVLAAAVVGGLLLVDRIEDSSE